MVFINVNTKVIKMPIMVDDTNEIFYVVVDCKYGLQNFIEVTEKQLDRLGVSLTKDANGGEDVEPFKDLIEMMRIELKFMNNGGSPLTKEEINILRHNVEGFHAKYIDKFGVKELAYIVRMFLCVTIGEESVVEFIQSQAEEIRGSMKV